MISTASREGSSSSTVGCSCCYRLPTQRTLLCILLRKAALSALLRTKKDSSSATSAANRGAVVGAADSCCRPFAHATHTAVYLSCGAKVALPVFVTYKEGVETLETFQLTKSYPCLWDVRADSVTKEATTKKLYVPQKKKKKRKEKLKPMKKKKKKIDGRRGSNH